MVLSFFGPKVVLFYEIMGGAFNAPAPAGNRVNANRKIKEFKKEVRSEMK